MALEDVRFGYGSDAILDGVSLEIGERDLAVLLGPNGGGKTTTVKLALGLLRPQAGTVRLFGQPVQAFHDWRRVAYVPQKAAGFEAGFPATVSELVEQGLYRGVNPLGLFGFGKPGAVADTLRFVGMWDHRNARVTELSRGQQQRVLIARAIVQQRDLLVLDEPVAGVDQAGQQTFYNLIQELNQNRGMAVVLISHDIGMAVRIATKVVCISRELVLDGAPEELTEGVLSRLYGPPMGLMVHHHEH